MKRHATILNFALLFLVGSIGSYSDAICSLAVTWTIQNGTMINNGTQYRFEVWARATDEPVLVTGNYSWDGINTVTIQWNQNAFGTYGDQPGQVISYSGKWAYPYYDISYGSFSTYPAVQVGFSLLPGNPSPSYLAQDVPYGELMFTVTLKIVNASFAPQLAWTTGYGYPVHGIQVATNTYTVGDNSPLPIQLASFKASILTSNGVALTWTTVTESNNYGFYVQRNGVDLTFIAGHGTTLQSHMYSYTDNPSPGNYQYRLMQVDLDGTATLSESVAIDVTAPSKFALNQNYPNPFNPSTQIAFSVTKDGPVSLRVYDILGREIATLVNENRKVGQYTEQFNGNQLASGVYVYALKSAEGQLTGRMMMLK